MLIHRLPSPELAPFVERLWHFDERDEAAQGPIGRAPRERVLPTGCASLTFRLTDVPARVFASEQDLVGRAFQHGAIGGARATSFVRDTSAPSRSVGVQFRPGGAAALLGVPGDELAERHTPLEELWGAEARRARERLLETATPEARLALFEQLLIERRRTARPPHPAVAHAIATLVARPGETSIRDLCRATGLSHGRLIELFRRAVGLTPRVFARVRRFQHALERAARGSCGGWAGVAVASGFYDQSHLIREFHALGGLAPGQYAPLAPDRPNHVPLRSSPAIPSNPAPFASR